MLAPIRALDVVRFSKLFQYVGANSRLEALYLPLVTESDTASDTP